MPLTISHGAFDGTCIEFHSWRLSLAKAAGYRTVQSMELYGMDEFIIFDLDEITADNRMGIWHKSPADPMLLLLAHSDDEGYIAPYDASRLADHLSALSIPQEWQTVTQKFVAGCRLASLRREPMEFTFSPPEAVWLIGSNAAHDEMVAHFMLIQSRDPNSSVH